MGWVGELEIKMGVWRYCRLGEQYLVDGHARSLRLTDAKRKPYSPFAFSDTDKEHYLARNEA